MILDGIEPMQAARGDDENGWLRDDAMRDFLVDLARDNKGLLVVTTRLPIPDLNGFRADQVAQHRLPNLPLSDAVTLMRGFGLRFPQEQMEALAREYGQTIARDPEHDGEATVRCHAKAIALIGAFIARRFKGAQLAPALAEITDAFRMPDEAFLGKTDEALKQEPGYTVYKMVRRYEILYEEAARAMKKSLVGCAPGRQLILLRVMGLFDRPATWGAFQAVLAAPAIPCLTDDLDRITPGEWQEAVAALREDGLLNPTPGDSHVLGADSILDAHPLIREYFDRRLTVVAKEAYRQAHARLYDYYRFQGLPRAFQEPVAYAFLANGAAFPDDVPRLPQLADLLIAGQEPHGWQVAPVLLKASPSALQSAKRLIDGPEWKAALKAFLPDDEAGMLPLFAAIAHGAASGLHTEAWTEVYRPRIARGNENFATAKLGLFGSDLAAIAHFFAEPFSTPAPGLSQSDQALVLNLAGFRLRALGRLAEAVEPMRVNLANDVRQERWPFAASQGSTLSELLVTLGRLTDDPATAAAGAVTTAAQAVDYADKSGDAFQRIITRTTHADALLQAGQWAAAAARFGEAEAMQRDTQPDLPLLYSAQGYRWCDLKLAQGRAGEVAARAEYALNAYEGAGQKWLLDIALDTLSLGRAAHLAAAEGAAPSPSSSAECSEAASKAGDPAQDSSAGHNISSASHNPPAGSPPSLAQARDGEDDADVSNPGQRFDDAVEGLRAAGILVWLPPGLLARAAWHRDNGALLLAQKDLNEAFDIAKRGGMQLFLADCESESAWLRLAAPVPTADDLAVAAAAIERAAAIVATTGYHRRDPDLSLARAGVCLARKFPSSSGENGSAAIRRDAPQSPSNNNEAASKAGDLTSSSSGEHAAGVSKPGDPAQDTSAGRIIPSASHKPLAGSPPSLAQARDGEDDGRNARPHIDDLVAAMRAHNLWGFLPHLECLAGQHGLDRDDAPTGLALGPLLAALRAERAAFDTDADAAFEDARKVRRADGLDDDVIDARLADPEFRSRLNAALVGSGYKPLDDTPIEEQRNDARNYILNVERKKTGAEGSGTDVDPASIPDELVDAMLADADFRTKLDEMLAGANLPNLASMDAEQQKGMARAFIAATLQAKAELEQQPGSQPPDTPPPPAAAPPPPPAQGQPQQSGGVLSRLFGRWMRK